MLEKYKKFNCRVLHLTLVGLQTLLLTGVSYAGSSNVTVQIKMTVVAPPCVINDNKAIEVEFGDVMTTKVDGNNYRMPVNYTLSCDDNSNNAMKLQIQGATAGFDAEALQTSVSALGIKMERVGSEFPVNTWLNFNYPGKPDLWAVPVMQPGATLPAGEFTATATMKVDYQ
ncbi:fimbrial protein [Klebsiella aerogenes]|uniref:fimbrial protein n=1 Tax=Klebsiella aerogenes TaxID=548 RepID=UPI00254CDEE0|nr:fimbrial protein [Klebsiella aerogenes]MDK7100077.1 fimbrial protein [Klebsiella aerogenes]MDK7850449.1 fimbrial protein [Klebsiella aerogenes]MDK8313042.1 fimbrial protein [Klebsiella aerogenes]